MNWQEHKIGLRRQSLLSDCFIQSVDELIAQALQEPFQSILIHSPRHFEQHLRDLGVLCDRMITYRREMQDLEILAVRAATDRMIHLASRGFERALSELQLGRQKSEDRQKLAAEVRDAFKKLDDPLANGFASDFDAQASFFNIESKDADTQLEYLRQRWRLTDDVSDSYWDRHNTPGNAHNYVYRWGWTRQLLIEDLREAYTKARATLNGIRVYVDDSVPEPPSSESLNYIDELILWTRSCFRLLESHEDSVQEFDLTIPIVQPFGEEGISLIPLVEFNSRLEKAAETPGTPLILEFELPALFATPRGARLKAIALSFSTEPELDRNSGSDRASQRTGSVVLQAIVVLPEQIYGTQTSEVIPPVRLGRVLSHDIGAGHCFVGGKLVNNVVPTGKWVLKVLPFAASQGGEPCQPFDSLFTYRLADFKLHLRGLGQLS